MPRTVVVLSLLATVASASPSPVLAQGARWYRGNTHAHTLNSDGDSPPETVARWYKEHGYHFTFITDHERITPVAPLNALLAEPGKFLVIPGQEITQLVGDSTHQTALIGRGGRVLATVTGTAPRYAITSDEGYVRAWITDSQGRRAWTQAVWVR